MLESSEFGPLLEVRNLSIQFGGLKAVSGFNLALNDGELVGLIGPNGAGKTTVFNMLTGLYKPGTGEIIFRGHNLIGQPAHKYAAAGIARTFQNIRLFGNLTAVDNIKIAQHLNVRYGMLGALWRPKRVVEEEARIQENAMDLLRKMGLADVADQLARNLPYGVQRRLEIARALASSPRLLLLDEPAAGMNPLEVDELADLIQWIRREFGVTILLIEHHMRLVMRICERIKVLDFGETIAEGTPDEVKTDPRVVEAYLGKGGKV